MKLRRCVGKILLIGMVTLPMIGFGGFTHADVVGPGASSVRVVAIYDATATSNCVQWRNVPTNTSPCPSGSVINAAPETLAAALASNQQYVLVGSDPVATTRAVELVARQVHERLYHAQTAANATPNVSGCPRGQVLTDGGSYTVASNGGTVSYQVKFSVGGGVNGSQCVISSISDMTQQVGSGSAYWDKSTIAGNDSGRGCQFIPTNGTSWQGFSGWVKPYNSEYDNWSYQNGSCSLFLGGVQSEGWRYLY